MKIIGYEKRKMTVDIYADHETNPTRFVTGNQKLLRREDLEGMVKLKKYPYFELEFRIEPNHTQNGLILYIVERNGARYRLTEDESRIISNEILTNQLHFTNEGYIKKPFKIKKAGVGVVINTIEEGDIKK